MNRQKCIIIGDRDGAAASAIEDCLKGLDFEVIYAVTSCYSCSLSGAVDEVLQQRLTELLEGEDHKESSITVILGGADPENCFLTGEAIMELFQTENQGRISIVHALENSMIERYNAAVYGDRLKILTLVLETEQLEAEMKKLRNKFV